EARTIDNVSAVVELQVTGTPSGDVRVHAVLDQGTLREARIGARPDALLSLTLPYDNALAVVDGSLDPTVAYMRGRLKTSGDDATLLALLSRSRSPGFRTLREELAAKTDS